MELDRSSTARRGAWAVLAVALVTAGCCGETATADKEPAPKAAAERKATPQPIPQPTPTAAKRPAAAQKPAHHASAAAHPPAAVHHPDGTARLRGIDISNWQGDVDWRKVKGDGIRFAYMQATQGLHFIDPNYGENAKGIDAAGLPYGAYHFFRPNHDPEAQAKLFLKQTEGKRGVLPPMLDVEVSGGQSAEQIGKRAKRWLEIVEQAVGCRPLVYSYGSFWEKNLRESLADYPLWLAEYASKPRLPAGKDRWVLWQYSQKGRVAGVKGAVDLDYFNGDEQALARFHCNQEGRS